MANQIKYSKLESAIPDSPSSNSSSLYSSSTFKWRPSRHIISYVVLIFSNIVLLSLWLSKLSPHDNCVRPQLIFSGPASEGATKYERRRLFRSLSNNPFTGPPRPEHDAAWGKLLEPMSIWITPDEYESADLGAKTLRLLNGKGYIGEMAVYHELHCIKRIRRHFHLDYYYPNMTDEEIEQEGVHMDHCLEYWREAAMCRGDPALATSFWRDALPTSRAYSDHECVNWEALDGWARSRMLDMNDPEIFDQTSRYDWISAPRGRTVWRNHPEIVVEHP